MKEDIKLYSPLDPIALALKLKAEMEARAKRRDRHVHGKGTELAMSLVYGNPNQLQGTEPEFEATMESQGEGTLITGEMSQTKRPLPFFLIWNGGVGLFFLFSVALWFVEKLPILFNLFFSGVPGLMLTLGLTMAYQSRNDIPEKPGKPQQIMDFLAETVDARPV